MASPLLASQSPPAAPKTPPTVPKKPFLNSKKALAGWKASPPAHGVVQAARVPASQAAKGIQTDSKLRLLRRPLCIICGRPKEAEEIAKALGVEENRVSGLEVEGVNDGHTFYLGSFDLGDEREEKLDYYITSSLRQGIQSFTIHSSILFHILRPRYAIHAGVCASYADPDPKKRFKLKDVIISEAALNYEEGKWEVVGGKKVFLPDFDFSRSPTGDMQAFAESRLVPLPTGLKSIVGSDNHPHYRYGDFISGSAVRKDASDIFNTIRSNVARNAIGLDMEASGFLKLCEYAGVRSLGVIKGISDFGNDNKGEDPAAYEDALRNTGFALKEWCMHSIPAVNWQPEDDLEPGGVITTGYYDNFVRMVLDAYCQGWPIKLKDNEAMTIPHHEVRGLKVVMPKDFKAEFFGEGGHITQVKSGHGLTEVSVGGRSYSRMLHYKAGYLIDFPRTTNSLAGYKDSTYQVQVFQRVLQRKPYFVSLEGAPLAEAFSWGEFVDWLNTVEIESKRKSEEQFVRETAQVEDTAKALQGEEAKLIVQMHPRRDPSEQFDRNIMVKKPTNQRPLINLDRDRKSLTNEPSWSVVDEPQRFDDDDPEEEDFEPPPCPPPPKVPPGWKAVWHDQYNEYYFVDIYSRTPRWQVPIKPAIPRRDSPTPILKHQNTSLGSSTISLSTPNSRSTS